MKRNYTINAVLFERDPGEWVAQCLQYDLGAQASDLPNLIYQLEKALVGHVVIALENGIQPFEGLSRAPDEYWEKWRRATIRVEPHTS